MKSKVPKCVPAQANCRTSREWFRLKRRLKRRQLRVIRKAFEDYRLGAAYLNPTDEQLKSIWIIDGALDQLEAMRE